MQDTWDLVVQSFALGSTGRSLPPRTGWLDLRFLDGAGRAVLLAA